MVSCPFLADLWRRSAGLPPVPEPKTAPFGSLPDAGELERTQWNSRFERLQRARLVAGAYRYGLLGAPGKPQFDRAEAIQLHLDQYRQTGNGEDLVDIANLCIVEFTEAPDVRFWSVDDGPHARQIGS